MDLKCANIVCDNGSGTIRIGWSGEDEPTSNFYSASAGSKPVSKYSSKLNESPIEKGVIKDWDSIERIWFEAFHDHLQVMDGNSTVLMTEPCFNPKTNREKITEIMFETFNVPAFYLANQAVLGAYGNGRVTGLVLDSGVDKTDAVPVYEGYSIPHAALRLDLGGNHLTDYLDKMLRERGFSLAKETVTEIKEKLCYVDVNYQCDDWRELNNDMEDATTCPSTSREKSFELPDGKIIRIEDEIFMCSEALFTHSLIGLDSVGIHEIVFDAMWKAKHRDYDSERVLMDFYRNIVLSGGSSSFAGLPEKIKRKQPYDKRIVRNLGEYPVKVVKSYPDMDKKNSTWVGGSILASLSTAEQMWISKNEFRESGSSFVHTKCF